MAFLATLNEFGLFTKKELLLLEQELEFRTLKKEEFLLSEGEVCSSLSFVVSGALYQYKFDSSYDKNVIDLYAPNDWVLNHDSFTNQKPSEGYIQSFENTTVYTLSMHAIHRLIAQSQAFLQMGKILGQTTSRVSFFDNSNTPDEKYQYILNHKPGLIQRFPQKLIASYLKITPETLSRVRKRFSRS